MLISPSCIQNTNLMGLIPHVFVLFSGLGFFLLLLGSVLALHSLLSCVSVVLLWRTD